MPILKKVICIVFTMLTTLFFVIALESWHDYQRSFNGPFVSANHEFSPDARFNEATASINAILLPGSDFIQIADYFTKLGFHCNVYDINRIEYDKFEYFCQYKYSKKMYYLYEKLTYVMKFDIDYKLDSFKYETLVN